MNTFFTNFFLATTLFCSGLTKTSTNKVENSLPLITIWRTTTPNETITLHVNSNNGNPKNYFVLWDNGNWISAQGDYTITFSNPGPHLVRMKAEKFEFDFSKNPNNSKKLREIIKWGNIPWKSMKNVFKNCTNLKIKANDVPNLSLVTDMSSMFSGVTGPIDISNKMKNWDVSNVTNMSAMFYNAQNFNQDIGSWNVGKVTNMSAMFYNAQNFNQDIGSWNVGIVSDMSTMFEGAERFNQDIGRWDVSNVNNMSAMFKSAERFNQEIGNWNVSNVTDMNGMFARAAKFNQDIGNWDVSNVTDMSRMLYRTDKFNQYIGGWDVSNVIGMNYMFFYAAAFNQDLKNWNIKNVTNMFAMFEGTSGMSRNNALSTFVGWLENAGISNYFQLLIQTLFNISDNYNIQNNVIITLPAKRHCGLFPSLIKRFLERKKNWTFSGEATFPRICNSNRNSTQDNFFDTDLSPEEKEQLSTFLNDNKSEITPEDLAFLNQFVNNADTNPAHAKVSLYPNPVNVSSGQSHINIQAYNLNKIVSYEIYAANGKLLKKEPLTKPQQNIKAPLNLAIGSKETLMITLSFEDGTTETRKVLTN